MRAMSPTTNRSLPVRFARHVRERELLTPGDAVVVAVSGGLDSVVLLHLLRFHPPLSDLRLTVAHLDHGLRARSPQDAEWVRGLCRAWGIPARLEVLAEPPRGEARARELRYDFLRRVQEAEGGDRIVTAHHADDQAETVLFRVLRGTGPRGLGGIRERSPEGLVRPLLPFWRQELKAYAGYSRLCWREDPTNEDRRFARNALRHRIIPEAEALVAAGARRSLVRLANIMAEDEAGIESLVEAVLGEVVESWSPKGVTLDREALLALHRAVQARVMRALAERLGGGLDEVGTRSAVRFAGAGVSGGLVRLSGGLSLRRDFGRLVLYRGEEKPQRTPQVLEIANSGPAEARITLGGRRLRVCWAPGHLVPEGPGSGPRSPGTAEGGFRWSESFSTENAFLPLLVRSWLPGDRVGLPYGTKKLKKLFAERGIPVLERPRQPVVVSGEGEVLWIPGVARSTSAAAHRGGSALSMGVGDADDA